MVVIKDDLRVWVTKDNLGANMLNNQFVKDVVGGLKGHPEAVLAFAMAVLGTILLLSGFNPWISGGVPAAFYVLYLLRMFMHDKHVENLEELNVQRLENEKGKPTRRKNIHALEKRGNVKRSNGQQE